MMYLSYEKWKYQRLCKLWRYFNRELFKTNFLFQISPKDVYKLARLNNEEMKALIRKLVSSPNFDVPTLIKFCQWVLSWFSLKGIHPFTNHQFHFRVALVRIDWYKLLIGNHLLVRFNPYFMNYGYVTFSLKDISKICPKYLNVRENESIVWLWSGPL